jgi:hypothetical protein
MDQMIGPLDRTNKAGANADIRTLLSVVSEMSAKAGHGFREANPLAKFRFVRFRVGAGWRKGPPALY